VPLPIAAASLVQDGQQLSWSVQLGDPFSPTRLQRDRRSLCLLIERAPSGSVGGELCIASTRRGQAQPQLVYLPITRAVAGRAKLVPATITRATDAQLTATFLPTDADIAYQPLRWQVVSTLAAPACVASTRSPECTIAFPTRPQLAPLHTPRLVGCLPSGPEFVAHGPVNRRLVALTFDDGPWSQTPQFLDVLERQHVVATFFEIGRQIATYGQGGAIERRMLADGDMIGDHTWSHADVRAGGEFAAQQILEAAAAIRTASGGFTPCLFRAPYGDVSPALLSLARALGYTTIQWNIDPRDWALPGVTAIYDNVIANAGSGSIILQHDGGGNRSETIAALGLEIDTLRREGFQFVTVTQLLGYRSIYR
jgi:peptidoglycan/xylan/chitin deacetylase (PgdA/CDA1 family)